MPSPPVPADVIYELLGEPLPPLDPYLEDFYVKARVLRPAERGGDHQEMPMDSCCFLRSIKRGRQ